jgi:ferredoxin/tRNA A-37 threonylcarbamoyl transferase component Bud32
MKKVALEPLGGSALIATGAPLLTALLAKDLRVLMSCGGRGICSTCHVRVCAGMDQLSPVGPNERRTLALVADATPDSRLACQATVFGDGVAVQVPSGMFLDKADDLLALLGTLAPANILHPINSAVLIPKGKLITRTLLEQSRSVEQEVRRLRGTVESAPQPPHRPAFSASGVTHRPGLSTHAQIRSRPPAEPGPTAGRAAEPVPAAGRAGGEGPLETGTITVTPPPARRKGAPPGADRPSARPDAEPRAAPGSARPPVTPPGAPFPIHAGAQVGKYLLLECIGKGGAGVVYRALHTALKRLVAVKFLRTAGDRSAREQLAGEAQLLAQLNHPNVVRVIDYEDTHAPYLVLEWVDGLSLDELIRQSGRLSVGNAVRVISQVCAALAEAHRLGIIHRDVKPGNVLFTRDGTAKLADFGLAMMAPPPRSGDDDAPVNRSAIIGTVSHMAPELFRGSSPDPRSDMYALGVTFYEALTGGLPFAGPGVVQFMLQHAEDTPAPPDRLVSDIPAEVSRAVMRMLEKEPGDRHQSYEELRADLQTLAARAGANGS